MNSPLHWWMGHKVLLVFKVYQVSLRIRVLLVRLVHRAQKVTLVKLVR